MRATPKTCLISATIALSIVLTAAACGRSTQGNGATSQGQTVTKAFSVAGMTCGSCPLTVRAAAKHVDGVTGAKVSVKEGKAWVTYDPKRATPDKIAKAITASGYATKPAP